MRALAERVGWALSTVSLSAAALLGTLALSRGWLELRGFAGFLASLFVWFGLWGLAGASWHRWTHAAWKPSVSGFGVNRACWFGALIHVVSAEAMRDAGALGWWWLDVGALLLVAAGFDALRPRDDRHSMPGSSKRRLLVAAACWPAMGLCLGLSAGQAGSGLAMGFLFLGMVAIVLFSAGAIFVEGTPAGKKAQAGALAEDLALLWSAGLPRRRAPAEAAPEPAVLSGFAFESEASAAAEAEGSSPERPEGRISRPTLVDSGGFRVDAEKALEKLSRFRSLESGAFGLAFFRCAALAGAKGFYVERQGPSAFSLRFDGEPLSEEALADPLSALLNGELEGADREFAAGLLGALGYQGCRVYAASGEGKKRRALRAAPKGGLRQEVRDPGSGTFVAVWGGWASGDAVELLQRRVGMIELRWTIDGREQPPGPPAPGPSGWHVRRRQGLEVRLAPRRDLESASRVRLYRLGTLIEEVLERKLTRFPVEACVRDDRFTLDISQAKVVRDERFVAALAAVDSTFGDFSAQLRRTHARRWPELMRAADPRGFLGAGWRAVRRAVGWRSAADVARDSWEREVRQWISAMRD